MSLTNKNYWKEEKLTLEIWKYTKLRISKKSVLTIEMAFFNSAVGTLQTLVVALGAGLGIWGAINLMEGYGNDNPGAKSQGMKHVIPSSLEQ